MDKQMNRILILDVKNFPDMPLIKMDEIFRRYIEEIWNAKLEFLGNYPNKESASTLCNHIKFGE
jgi:hypothetical protein